MRIGIFVVMAGRQAGGPETYERGLVEALARLDTNNEYQVLCLNRAAAGAFEISASNMRLRALWPGLRVISMSTSLPWVLWRERIDLLHATFTPPPLSPRPYVFTHHCFSTFAHPEFYAPTIRWRLNALIVRGLRRARRIICVSENVRDLTAEKFRLPHERMPVVYNGVGPNFHPLDRGLARAEVARRYRVHTPFVLYVGKLESRKNIVRLLQAFRMFRAEIREPYTLVLAGRRTPMSVGIDAAIDSLGLRAHVVEIGHLPNADLPLLYNAAEMFAFPSLWEGFGIPVVESMACATPVITSNVSSLPEVTDGAALLVDPYSTDDIGAAMFELARDASLRAMLAERGLRRAQHFTWEQTARRTLAVYQDCHAD